jgi:hypothetical protein
MVLIGAFYAQASRISMAPLSIPSARAGSGGGAAG